MKYSLVCLLVLMTLPGCDHDEAVNPVVITSDPPQLGTTSAVIEGNIKEPGSVRPVKYGFLWGTTPDQNILTADYKIDLGSTATQKVYQVALTMLTANTQYYVRAYASNPDYSKIYYGNEVAFTTLP